MKDMRRSVRVSVLSTPGPADVLPASQIADALGTQFPLAGANISAENLSAGDILLLIGTGRWAHPDSVRELREAARRGVRRVLWQLEPLPPPVEGWPRRILTADLANARGAWKIQSPLGKVARTALGSTLASALTVSMRHSPVDPSLLRARKIMGYPLKQARDIAQFWRDGLLDHILVSVPSRQAFLAQHQIPSEVVPVGFMRELGSIMPGLARDIDVLFLGQVSDRRADLLASIQARLQRHGRVLHIVDRNCYGEARTRILNRSKIILNLQKFPWEFPIIRLLMAMACKTLVVSESAGDPGPFLEDRHLIVRDAGELGEALVTYLARDDERARITDAAHAFVTEEFTLASLLSEALVPIAAEPRIGSRND